MGSHKRYFVDVPGGGKMDNMTIAGYTGVAPAATECDDFEDNESTE